MNSIKNKEIILAILVILFAICVTDPFMFFMPSPVQMAVLVGLLVLFVAFSVFFWKESPQDEREELHRLKSGKAGFFVGSTILIVGIIYQVLNHELNSWLVGALVGMVAAKALSLYKSNRNN